MDLGVACLVDNGPVPWQNQVRTVVVLPWWNRIRQTWRSIGTPYIHTHIGLVVYIVPAKLRKVHTMQTLLVLYPNEDLIRHQKTAALLGASYVRICTGGWNRHCQYITMIEVLSCILGNPPHVNPEIVRSRHNILKKKRTTK